MNKIKVPMKDDEKKKNLGLGLKISEVYFKTNH
jgi:hypothetical protein